MVWSVGMKNACIFAGGDGGAARQGHSFSCVVVDGFEGSDACDQHFYFRGTYVPKHNSGPEAAPVSIL